MMDRLHPMEWDPSGSFCIAALPDSQHYVDSDFAQERLFCLERQIDWILEHVKDKNIRFITHVGDYANHANRPEEYEAFFGQYDRLLGHVPYGLASGNHDLFLSPARLSQFTSLGKTCDPSLYLGPGVQEALAVRRAHFSQARLGGQDFWIDSVNEAQSNAQTFTAFGHKFIAVHLEFGPDDQTVEWASQLFQDHTDCHGILTTHAFLTPFRPAPHIVHPEDRLSPTSPGMIGNGDNAGIDIYNRIVKPNANVFLVLCGHYVAELCETYALENRQVHAMAIDYEYDLPYRGNGLMRLLRFDMTEHKIHAYTFSPALGLYQGNVSSQFSLPLHIF